MESSRRMEIKDTEITELRALLKDREEEINLVRRRMRAAEDEAIMVRREMNKDSGAEEGLRGQVGYLREKYEEEIKALKDDLYYKQKVHNSVSS